jgi:hypothetical protein
MRGNPHGPHNTRAVTGADTTRRSGCHTLRCGRRALAAARGAEMRSACPGEPGRSLITKGVREYHHDPVYTHVLWKRYRSATWRYWPAPLQL